MKKGLLIGGIVLLVYVIIPALIFQFVSGWKPTPELNLGHYYIAGLMFLTPVILFFVAVMKFVSR